jgi:hypothetical protein
VTPLTDLVPSPQRRSRRRLAAWLVLLGLLLLALAGFAWARLLHGQGIERLAVSGLRIGTDGVQMERVLVQRRGTDGARLYLVVDDLLLDWRDAGRLRIGQLNIDLDTPAHAGTEGSATLDIAALPELPSWLPRRVDIQHIDANLPCAAGRCALQGSLALRHAGAALFPISLELNLNREERQVQLLGLLEGDRQAPRLSLGLAIDEQPRASLLAALMPNADGQSLSGQLSVPNLREAPWLVKWLGEWMLLSEQRVPLAPEAMQLAADWQLQLPAGALRASDLGVASGSARVEAHLPQPWPLPDVGQVQGDLQLSATADRGHWLPTQARATLRLDNLAGSWRDALPAGLRADRLDLRIVPAERPRTDGLLPFDLQLTSQGTLAATLEAKLATATQLPWALQIDSARLRGQTTKLEQDGLRLTKPSLDLTFSGRIDQQQAQLLLGNPAQLRSERLDMLKAGQSTLELHALQATLPGVSLDARYSGAGLDILRIQGPARLQTTQLRQASLQPQGWNWQGTFDTDLAGLKLDGALGNDAGLAVQVQLGYAYASALQLKAQMQELFMRAGNPLAKTLADWPALLDLGDGRLRGNAQFDLRDGVPALDLTLSAQNLGGIYDRVELSGLSGDARVKVTDKTLQLELPDLRLDELNPGLAIGPLRFAGRYRANLQNPAAGRLDWQHAETTLLGGRLWLEPGNGDLAAAGLDLPLQVQGLQLAELFRAYPAEGLSGDGLLDGRLPLHWNGRALRIENGEVAARPPGGMLRFHSPKIIALAQANPAMKRVADALEDFRYERLSSAVSYDEAGKLMLNLRLNGRNPDLERGRPFNFTINLQEDIPALLTSLQLSERVSETIQRRVQERLQRAAASPTEEKP